MLSFDDYVYRFLLSSSILLFFFFNDTATTEIYTLSLHDALPILRGVMLPVPFVEEEQPVHRALAAFRVNQWPRELLRSEEHTSELQSRSDLVCRLLLEKKKKIHNQQTVLHTNILYAPVCISELAV